MTEPIKFNPHQDCNLRNEFGHFRMRAVGLIFENECVLLATNERENFYYFVGGGVHINETTSEAAKREIFEETGVEYEIERLLFVHENFFECNTHHHGLEEFHEVGFYYLMKSRGVMDAQEQPVPEGCLVENLKWVRLDELSNYRIEPKCIADRLKDLPQTVEHLVTL